MKALHAPWQVLAMVYVFVPEAFVTTACSTKWYTRTDAEVASMAITE